MTWTKKKVLSFAFGLSFVMEDLVSMTQKQKEEEGARLGKERRQERVAYEFYDSQAWRKYLKRGHESQEEPE